MSTPAKRPADLIKPSSFAEPMYDFIPPSEEETRAWWRWPVALACAGLVYIALGYDIRFPWAWAGSLSLAEKSGKPANHQAAQLIVKEATPALMDQPAPLGVSVDSANDLSLLKISGLPKGAALSAGVSVGYDGWLLYGMESKGAEILPPPHFVGVMKLNVSLFVGGNINASEIRPLQFAWVAGKVSEIKLPVEMRPEAKVQDEAPPLAKVRDEAPPFATARDEAPPLGKARDEAPPAAKSTSQTSRQLSPDETAALLKRGNELVASGDFAAARLVLQRAAEAGNARAAFALAGTYNPITLGELHVHGLTPDLATARRWYERANELGSPDASRELQVLTIRRN
jgi:hypothetical protein